MTPSFVSARSDDPDPPTPDPFSPDPPPAIVRAQLPVNPRTHDRKSLSSASQGFSEIYKTRKEKQIISPFHRGFILGQNRRFLPANHRSSRRFLSTNHRSPSLTQLSHKLFSTTARHIQTTTSHIHTTTSHIQTTTNHIQSSRGISKPPLGI